MGWVQRVVGGLTVLLVAGALAGCGLSGKEPKGEESDGEEGEKVEKPPVRLVGEVASVHAEEGFVLIRRYAQGDFGGNHLLAAMGEDGTSASLRLTGERLGRYYAADVQEGTPEKGDLVVLRQLPKEAETPSTPLPQVPKGGQTASGRKKLP